MSKWRAGQASGPGDDDVGLLATGADEGVEHGLHEAGVLGDDPCGKRACRHWLVHLLFGTWQYPGKHKHITLINTASTCNENGGGTDTTWAH